MNGYTDHTDEQTRRETLRKLYALQAQIDRAIAKKGVQNPRSESERHLQLTGHRLEYGCCRAASA